MTDPNTDILPPLVIVTTHRVIDLAIRIADESTRSDIECLCSRADAGPDGVPWFDITNGPDDDVGRQLIAAAVEYLTLRGKIERRGDLVRVAGFPT